jgi:hypothetical protein
MVDPDDGNIVYAGSNGDGVYKSTDGGNSFARVGSPAVGVVLSIVKSGSKLYAGTAGGGVSVSEDGGATWRNAGVPRSMALMLSVDGEGSVYAGTNFHGAYSQLTRRRSGIGLPGRSLKLAPVNRATRWRWIRPTPIMYFSQRTTAAFW